MNENKQKTEQSESVKELAEKPLVYKLPDGAEMKLTMNMVKAYLVTGNRELVTTQELMFFMQICKARQLNPFLRDCWLIKYSGSEAAQIVTSIHKIRATAMENPRCTGWRTGLIFWDRENKKTFETQGLVPPGDFDLLGAFFESQPQGWSDKYRLEVNLQGYIKKTRQGDITQFWKPEKQPMMIMKVAESQGLRTLYQNQGGYMYVEEELVGEHHPLTEMRKTEDGTWSSSEAPPDYGGDAVDATSEPDNEAEEPVDPIEEFNTLAEKDLADHPHLEAFMQQLREADEEADHSEICARVINDWEGFKKGLDAFSKAKEQQAAKEKKAEEAKKKKEAAAKKKKEAAAKKKAAKKTEDEAPPPPKKKADEGPSDPDPPPSEPGDDGELFEREPGSDDEDDAGEDTPIPNDYHAELLRLLNEDPDTYAEACMNLGYSNTVVPPKGQIKTQAELYDEILKVQKGERSF